MTQAYPKLVKGGRVGQNVAHQRKVHDCRIREFVSSHPLWRQRAVKKHGGVLLQVLEDIGSCFT